MTDTTTLTPEQALAKAKAVVKGGAAGIARVCGISRAAVNQWDRCPAERVLAVERATDGEVPRHQLRPDLYPPPPPEAAGEEEAA